MENQLSDDEYFRRLPAGFRFKPTHGELIVHYLMKKIKKEVLPRNKINVANLYEFNPEILAVEYGSSGENEWLFFTPRNKKYKNGKRPNRAAGDGFWKASGADTAVIHDGVDVGSRKTLVYYEGKPPKKTSWIMHEYTVNNPPPVEKSSEDDMKLDDWVLCRIRKNENRKRKRDDQIQESDNNTDESACHQENKRRAAEASIDVAPEDNSPHYESEIPWADSFINDNFQNLPNADVYNSFSIPQHQNVVTYSNPVPIPNIVPPNHWMGGYAYSQYPVDHMADVREGLYQELNGIPEMDVNMFLSSVHQESPGLDSTNNSYNSFDNSLYSFDNLGLAHDQERPRLDSTNYSLFDNMGSAHLESPGLDSTNYSLFDNLGSAHLESPGLDSTNYSYNSFDNSYNSFGNFVDNM